MSSAATWQTTIRHSGQQHDAQARTFTRRFLRRGLVDARILFRYVLRYGILTLAILGAFELWSAQGDGPIPTFRPIPASAVLNPHQVSSGRCMLRCASDAERWAGLAPALAILKSTNPEIADWVERSHAEGRLVFTNHTKDDGDHVAYLAKFDLFQRELRIGPGLFAEPDGSIAAVLAHEYRHSRQKLPKVISYALSFVFLENGDPSIIENDAVLYEQAARRAIFDEPNEALDAFSARLAAH